MDNTTDDVKGAKLYAERDHESQGEYYMRHLSAMTGERLHEKSAIAGELAHRDMRIDQLAAERDAAVKFKTYVHERLDKAGIPHSDPDNQHQKEGCRIGARLDLLFAERDTLRFGRNVWRATYLRKVQEAEKLKARLANAEDLLRERRQLYERIDHDTDEKREWREKVDAYFFGGPMTPTRNRENNWGFGNRWSFHCDKEGKWTISYHAGDSCYGVGYEYATEAEMLEAADKERSYYENLPDDPPPMCIGGP